MGVITGKPKGVCKYNLGLSKKDLVVTFKLIDAISLSAETVISKSEKEVKLIFF